MTRCLWCGDRISEKDVIALNRKMISRDTGVFYCLPCMAENFGCSEDDLLEKIKEFKEEGCTLFG